MNIEMAGLAIIEVFAQSRTSHVASGHLPGVVVDSNRHGSNRRTAVQADILAHGIVLLPIEGVLQTTSTALAK